MCLQHSLNFLLQARTSQRRQEVCLAAASCGAPAGPHSSAATLAPTQEPAFGESQLNGIARRLPGGGHVTSFLFYGTVGNYDVSVAELALCDRGFELRWHDARAGARGIDLTHGMARAASPPGRDAVACSCSSGCASECGQREPSRPSERAAWNRRAAASQCPPCLEVLSLVCAVLTPPASPEPSCLWPLRLVWCGAPPCRATPCHLARHVSRGSSAVRASRRLLACLTQPGRSGGRHWAGVLRTGPMGTDSWLSGDSLLAEPMPFAGEDALLRFLDDVMTGASGAEERRQALDPSVDIRTVLL